MTNTTPKSNDSQRKQLLQLLGRTLMTLTPAQREQAIKIAGMALAVKAKKAQTKD